MDHRQLRWMMGGFAVFLVIIAFSAAALITPEAGDVEKVGGLVSASTDSTTADDASSSSAKSAQTEPQISDVDCSAQGLGSDKSARFTSAFFVVDGELGAVCFGEWDDTLSQSWDMLSSIAGPDELRDLALFGGFAGNQTAEIVTLAFVTATTDDESLYQISVNLDEAERDRDELAMTLSHEFTHIMTARPDQLDRFGGPGCATYLNGDGCYTSGSFMNSWIETFWGGGLLDEVEPGVDSSADEALDRCDLYPGFFGSYAATSPEEDFAESFSAFVHNVPARTTQQQNRLDWFGGYARFVGFRERAELAGLSGFPNLFYLCGEG